MADVGEDCVAAAQQDGEATLGPGELLVDDRDLLVDELIVDDQPLVRSGIAFIISTEPGMRVVSEVSNGELALVSVKSHRPDVVLMDIRMPVMDGITATRHLHDAGGPPVLVLTTSSRHCAPWPAVDHGSIPE